jgi:hypothetical protein
LLAGLQPLKKARCLQFGENAAGDAPRAAALHGPSRPSPVTTAVHRPDQAAVEQERVSNARRRPTHRHHRIDVGSIEQRRPAQKTREGKAPQVLVARTCEAKSLPATTVISRVEDSSRPGCDEAEVPINEIESLGGAGPPNPPGAGVNRRPPRHVRPPSSSSTRPLVLTGRSIGRRDARVRTSPSALSVPNNVRRSSEPLPVEGGSQEARRRSGRPSGKTSRRTSLRGSSRFRTRAVPAPCR